MASIQQLAEIDDLIEKTYPEIIEETDKMQEHLASLRTQLEAKRKTREKSADK